MRKGLKLLVSRRILPAGGSVDDRALYRVVEPCGPGALFVPH